MLTEKEARLLGIYKGLLQLDECNNIRTLPRLKQRLTQIEKEFKDKGLAKAVSQGMNDKAKLTLVPDQHMEKRLMSLGLINKTAYLKQKEDKYREQLGAVTVI
jgi:hypothetical protein